MPMPIDFPESNSVQTGYDTEDDKDMPNVEDLHSYRTEVETISCWKLSFKDIFKLIFRRVIWVRLYNMNQPCQPISIETTTPFIYS